MDREEMLSRHWKDAHPCTECGGYARFDERCYICGAKPYFRPLSVADQTVQDLKDAHHDARTPG